MEHNDKLNLLPQSIYDTEPTTNNYKLWNLFAGHANELEVNFTPVYELGLTGVWLDKIGMILGKPRKENQTDDEYRSVLYRSSIVKDINSLNAIYNQLKRIPEIDSIRIVEMFREPTSLLLDGLSALNGNFRLDPLSDGDRFLMDGKFYMGNEEPMSPSIREACFEVFSTAQITTDFKSIYELTMEVKPAGGGVYLRFLIPIEADAIRLYNWNTLLGERDLSVIDEVTETIVANPPVLVNRIEIDKDNQTTSYTVRMWIHHFMIYKFL